MFSGQTLGALTSAQEGASNLRQAIDALVANQLVSQLGSNGELSLAQVENALGVSGGTASGSSATGSSAPSSTSSNTVSTLDGLAAAFASVDTNGDGQLSADELANALNQMTGPGQTPGHHGHHHHHVDNDGDDGAANALASTGSASTTSPGTSTTGSGSSTTGASGSTGTGASDPSSITGTTASGSTTSGPTTSGSTTTGAAASDPTTTSSSVASTSSNSTSTNTVSTLDGLTSAEFATALQAFLASLAQSQAANLNAMAQANNPTSVTA
jgi:mucin-2